MWDRAPWMALAVVGLGVEAWTYRHRPSATLTRVTRSVVHPEHPAGAVVLGFGLGWIAGHLVAGE